MRKLSTSEHFQKLISVFALLSRYLSAASLSIFFLFHLDSSYSVLWCCLNGHQAIMRLKFNEFFMISCFSVTCQTNFTDCVLVWGRLLQSSWEHLSHFCSRQNSSSYFLWKTEVWGLLESTEFGNSTPIGNSTLWYCGSWQKCSLSHSHVSAVLDSWVTRSWQMWSTSASRARRRFPENYRPVSLTSVQGRSWNWSSWVPSLAPNRTIRESGPVSMGLGKAGPAWDQPYLLLWVWSTLWLRESFGCVYLELSKAFDAISQSILLQKLAGCIFSWMENDLDGQAQRVVKGLKSTWWLVRSESLRVSTGASPV